MDKMTFLTAQDRLRPINQLLTERTLAEQWTAACACCDVALFEVAYGTAVWKRRVQRLAQTVQALGATEYRDAFLGCAAETTHAAEYLAAFEIYSSLFPPSTTSRVYFTQTDY